MRDQIKELLKGADIDKEEMMSGWGPDTLGPFKLKVEKDYGGEDQGSDYWAVWSFTDYSGDVAYVKFYGYYQSYDGAEYQGWKFVTPKLVTVTQWS